MGNLRNISKAVYSLGFDFTYVDTKDGFNGLSHLIIPGVGSFYSAVEHLNEKNLRESVSEFANSKKPILGICLGMQLLATFGEEGGISSGLNLIPGRILKLDLEKEIRLPHIGWNTTNFCKKHPVFQGVKDNLDFYYVHSYYFKPDSTEFILAESDYGMKFSGIVGHNNVLGFQFHPEKSQINGLKLLENFCNWDGIC